jgi:hypothetical protein
MFPIAVESLSEWGDRRGGEVAYELYFVIRLHVYKLAKAASAILQSGQYLRSGKERGQCVICIVVKDNGEI